MRRYTERHRDLEMLNRQLHTHMWWVKIGEIPWEQGISASHPTIQPRIPLPGR